MSKITLNLVPDGPRRCGGCTLCCKLLPMGYGTPMEDGTRYMRSDEFEKPAGQKCPHQRTGKGCAIYSRRPACCAVWNCRWLGNPEETVGLKRPDRSHVVIDIMPDFISIADPSNPGKRANIEVVQIWVDPGYRDAYKDPAVMNYMARKGEEGIATIIRYSSSDCFVIFPPAMTQDGTFKEEHGGTAMPERTSEARLDGLAKAQHVKIG